MVRRIVIFVVTKVDDSKTQNVERERSVPFFFFFNKSEKNN